MSLCTRRFTADMKMHLAGTDYGNFLQNEPSPISSGTLQEKLTVRARHPLFTARSLFGALRLGAAPPPSTPRSHPVPGPAPCSLPLPAQEKLVDEFNFLRSQAVEPLATFMDYITAELKALAEGACRRQADGARRCRGQTVATAGWRPHAATRGLGGCVS
eukprot:2570669-Pleurochrysis_carterae.AAC.2